jgi:hypothetical protein
VKAVKTRELDPDNAGARKNLSTTTLIHTSKQKHVISILHDFSYQAALNAGTATAC